MAILDESSLSLHYPILESIETPQDLRALPRESLPELCRELRSFLLDELSIHPGHLGSSLGAVELNVALHYVFLTPFDRIVWDVGHQAYVHKILTERRKSFYTLRQWKGVGGFPSPSESIYDTFPAGHASNSISAALGMAVAAAKKKEERKVVAVIGDGSMTGGLAFEGLNNVSSFPNDLLVILNDNNMSIDNNVGGLNHYLVDLNTSKAYNAVRYDIYKLFRRFNVVGEESRKAILRFNNSLKSAIGKTDNTFFQGLNIRYFGPIDGNDVLRLVTILGKIKEMKGPKLLHIRTIKGKGYPPAEADPTTWHAPDCFNILTGERKKESAQVSPPKFQDVFGTTLVDFAKKDERIVGVTPAMPTGCSMSMLFDALPDQAYDVGIAEAHAVTFSAGLAKEGLIPFCNIYSSFAQRSFDQIIHDVCLARYHVILCLDRAGLVGEDGATHQGAFDLAYLRIIPNLIVAAPLNEHYLQHLMYTAYKGQNGPMAIRYPRGKGSCIDWQVEPEVLPIGKGRILSEGNSHVAILSLGAIGVEVQKAIDSLRKAEEVCPTHYDMVFLKPLDEELLKEIAQKYNTLITVEDGCLTGGFGSAIGEVLNGLKWQGKLVSLGIPDEFIPHGTVAEQKEYCGIDAKTIASTIRSLTGDILSKED